MAARKTAHEKVMDLVERELKKNPKASTTELYEKAKGVSRTVSRLSIRQFHAKYPLQVKRRLGRRPKSSTRKFAKKRSTARAKPRSAKSAIDRDAVRTVFLSFAKDLSAAGDQQAVIELIASVDKYVDRIAKAVQK